MPIGIVDLYVGVEEQVAEQANADCEGHDSCDSSTCDSSHCQSEN